MVGINRRSFLRTSAGASALAAGGVAVMAIPFTPIPSAEDRARKAWAEFCGAMRDLADDADGWTIVGAGQRWTKLHPHETGEPFLNVRSVHYVEEPIRPGSPKMITVERHRYIVPLTDPRQLEIEP